MKNLYFNRQTLLGESKTPISLEVKVNEDFALTKDVQEVDHLVHKENEEGEKLYFKDIYRTEVEEVFVGYDETLEETEKPLMEIIHVVDEEGNKLYREIIYNEEGESVDTFITAKSHNENGELNEAILEEVQKTTENGLPIYLKPVYKTVEHEVFDHVAEVTEETENPVMEEVYKTVTKDIFTNPEAFTVQEVLIKQYLGVLDNSNYDYIIADIFLNEEDLDAEKTFANTGVGILQLPPKGYAVTKSIELEQASNKFKIIDLEAIPSGISMYINTKKVVNGEAVLTNATSKIAVKFVNTTDKYLDIKSYTILY